MLLLLHLLLLHMLLLHIMHLLIGKWLPRIRILILLVKHRLLIIRRPEARLRILGIRRSQQRWLLLLQRMLLLRR